MDKEKQEIRNNQIRILATMAYGYNGANPNNPKFSEEGVKYAIQTLEDIVEDAVKKYIQWFNKTAQVDDSERNWWSYEEYVLSNSKVEE